jgi:hypothetical protein
MVVLSLGNIPSPFVAPLAEVGDGRTSVKRDGGSLRLSEFQIPLPHGNDVDAEGPRPIAEVETDCKCEPHVPDSADGVVGWDAVGDIVLLANEPFRGCPNGCVVSFNHEARRVGF